LQNFDNITATANFETSDSMQIHYLKL